MNTSLYIHIPFCRRKCSYCNFYSDIYENELTSAYIDVLSAQIEKLEQEFSTIYIGGGTPTVLDKGLLRILLNGLKRFLCNAREFTVEANPESLDDDKIGLLLDSGVNRLSIGVQSLNDQKLKRLGRIHTATRAKESMHSAAKKGFKNISADLIFGIWDEDTDKWRSEVAEMAKMPITHISCYELTYEKNTPLFLAVKNNSIAPLEDDVVAAMYEQAIDLLALGGFKQYEVSNFSKEGFECKHNLNYWDNGPYIGLGPSAFSYIDGVRQKNVADVREYIKRAGSGKTLIEFSEKLSPVRRAKEAAAVKIRTKEGIDFKLFKDKTGFDFLEIEKKVLTKLIEEGFIKYKKENNEVAGVCLKRKGFLFCDTVSSAFL